MKEYCLQHGLDTQRLRRNLRDMLCVVPQIFIPERDYNTIPPHGFCGWLVILKLLNPGISLDLSRVNVYKSLQRLVRRVMDTTPDTALAFHKLLSVTEEYLTRNQTSRNRHTATFRLYLPQDHLMMIANMLGIPLFLFEAVDSRH
jgi:hypothetical protein